MKGIYVIKKKDGTPVYVGRSTNMYSRWGQHLETYPYKKYDYEVLEIISFNGIAQREQYWITKMNTLLEGNNQCNAVKVVETRTKRSDEFPPFTTTYSKGRNIVLYNTFEGEGCSVCGETVARYLQWYPNWNKIRSSFMRHGKHTPERTEAYLLIDDSTAICQNCLSDREWGELRGLWPN